MAKNSDSRAPDCRTVTGRFVSADGAPRGGVLRGARMPDGSTFVTIDPETSRAASARATRKIMESRTKTAK